MRAHVIVLRTTGVQDWLESAKLSIERESSVGVLLNRNHPNIMDAYNDNTDNMEATPNAQNNRRRNEGALDDEDVSSGEIPPTPHTSRRPLPVGGWEEEEEVEATPIPQPHRSIPRGGLRINTSSDVLHMASPTPTSNMSRRNFELPTAPFTPVDHDDDISEPHTVLTPLSLTSFGSVGASPQEEEHRHRDGNDDAVSMGSPQHRPNVPHEFPQQQHAVIWGTDVNVPTAARAFKDFILTFRSVEISRRVQQREERRQRRRRRREGRTDEEDTYSSTSDDDSGEALLPPIHYLNQLSLIHASQPPNPFVDIDTLCLYYHNAECQRLYHQLVKYPQEIVPIMDMMINQVYQERFIVTEEDQIAYNLSSKIQVRPFNLRHLSQMRALDPLAIDTLLSLQGMVVRCSPLVPDLKIASFVCQICGHVLEVTVDRGKIAEPTQCNTCLKKNSHKLIHNRSIYSNKQVVRLQETPDEVPAGETPASIVMLVYDNLVDGMRPGDRVSEIELSISIESDFRY